MHREFHPFNEQGEQPESEEGRDRTPPLRAGIERVMNDDQFPDTVCSRVEIGFLASGELTWRVFDRGGEEAEGGVIRYAD
jgi:hypothetical protein